MTPSPIHRLLTTTLIAAMACGIANGPAYGATDLPLDGKRIRLRDAAAPAGRRNVAGFLDASVSTSGIDPRVTGGTLSIGAVGLGPVTTIDLPASGWGPSEGTGRTYRYRALGTSVVRVRIVNERSLRFSITGPAGHALAGTPQGAVGAVLEVGSVRFCGLFGGSISRDDGATFRARDAAAPASCPTLGATTTSTTTTTTLSTTTTTAPGPYMCQFDNNSNLDVDGCSCDTNGDCVGSCSCGAPCTPGSCPMGTTCITDPASSAFGSCSGVCPPSPFNVCTDGTGSVPFCTDPFDNNGNRSAHGCMCNTDGDCIGDCSNNNVPNTTGVCVP